MAFLVMVAFLVTVFLLGGGSRSDIESLILLRPLAVLVCGFAILGLTREQFARHQPIFAMAAGLFLLIVLQLVPLPPQIWTVIPGRAIVSEVDVVSGLAGSWRPLAMVPQGAWNALYSLFCPLAVLLLGVQLSRAQRYRLVPVLLTIGCLSGFWGLLQAVGASEIAPYLYRITNEGAAVGLFANRNHQAAFLATLFPLLAVYASSTDASHGQPTTRLLVAVAMAVVLVPLILVTGSRAGLVAGLMGLLLGLAIYRRPQIAHSAKAKRERRLPFNYLLTALLVVLLAGATMLMSRAEAISRLLSADQTEENRFAVWGAIWSMVLKYFPFGSGAGSFAEVYMIDEDLRFVRPTYLNHAHNDWLEVLLTDGLFGAAALLAVSILVVCGTAKALSTTTLSSPSGRLAMAGAAIIVLLGFASLVDYPIRTPSLACLFVVAALWLSSEARADKEGMHTGAAPSQESR